MEKWLDKYKESNLQEYQENYNNSSISVPIGFNGMSNNTQGRNYSPAWNGQFQMGGNLPGSVGFTYARTGDIPSNGKYAKKTMASAQNGMSFYQNGLDWKPKTISEDGIELIKLDQLTNFTNCNNPSIKGGWLNQYYK